MLCYDSVVVQATWIESIMKICSCAHHKYLLYVLIELLIRVNFSHKVLQLLLAEHLQVGYWIINVMRKTSSLNLTHLNCYMESHLSAFRTQSPCRSRGAGNFAGDDGAVGHVGGEGWCWRGFCFHNSVEVRATGLWWVLGHTMIVKRYLSRASSKTPWGLFSCKKQTNIKYIKIILSWVNTSYW